MPNNNPKFRQMQKRRRGGDKRWFGLFIIMVGVFILFKKLDLIPHINWHNHWPIILIAVGLFVGIKNRFSTNAPFILVGVGVCYLIPEFMILGVSSTKLILPAILILIGIALFIRPGKKGKCADKMQVVTSDASTVNLDVTFGGRKEIVTSKQFQGGSVSTTFGGIELNLTQADSITQPMVMKFKVSFGGVELIVPPHWEIQNEVTPSFGSVEDHRSIPSRGSDDDKDDKKVLVLEGSCSFGSIEIKSY